jgi:hypothetical protein
MRLHFSLSRDQSLGENYADNQAREVCWSIAQVVHHQRFVLVLRFPPITLS